MLTNILTKKEKPSHKDNWSQSRLSDAPITTKKSLNRKVDCILEWADHRLSRVVCIINTHLIVAAHNNPAYRQALCSADLLVLNDPIIARWIKYFTRQEDSYISDIRLFLLLCERAEREEISIFLLGSQSFILKRIQLHLSFKFPNIKIAGTLPFDFYFSLTNDDESIIQQVNASNAGLIFISLGCQKQEVWMTQHRDKIQGVMLGFGNLFPRYIGLEKYPPAWMSKWKLKSVFNAYQVLQHFWFHYIPDIFTLIQLWLADKSFLRLFY